MNELATFGILPCVISAGVSAVDFSSGEMPCNYAALDTGRATAPITFWMFASFWTSLAAAGAGPAIRYWSA